MGYSKNGMLVVTYDGKIDLPNTTVLVKKVIDTHAMEPKNTIKGILISLKKCGSFAEPSEMKTLFESLVEAQKKSGVDIAMIDYSPVLYGRMKACSKEYSIRLLSTFDTASLFLNPQSLAKELTVLIYEPDAAICAQIKKALSQNSYTIFVAKDNDTYQNFINGGSIDVTISQTLLSSKDFSQNKAGKRLKISKELVSNLPLFIDTAVETLVSLTELDAKKSQHGIGSFRSDLNERLIAAQMKFNGAIEGTFFLIFPQSIASKALSALMGEAIEETDMDTLKDGVAEFCNIITGSIKTKLQDKQIPVLFELPKTYESLQDAAKIAGTHEGIWIDMVMETEPFYIFISQ